MDAFRAKNKVATTAAIAAGTLDVRSIKALATSLPQYRRALLTMLRILSAGQSDFTVTGTAFGPDHIQPARLLTSHAPSPASLTSELTPALRPHDPAQ
jgi:hypothetical protein